jgi:hypothetical protein
MPAAMMLGNLGIGQLDPDFPKPFQGPPLIGADQPRFRLAFERSLFCYPSGPRVGLTV